MGGALQKNQVAENSLRFLKINMSNTVVNDKALIDFRRPGV
jgi:hypothetical protein